MPRFLPDDALEVDGPEPAGAGAALIRARGEVTFANATILRAALERALDGEERHVVVDLSGVPFMDSSGVAVLLTASRDARDQGRWVSLVHAGDPPSIFRFKGIAGLLRLHATVDAALAQQG